MLRIATPAGSRNLSASQERALAALLTGESVTAAAKTAKVSRQTVHRWMRAPDFQAAFNAARNDLRSEMETRLENVASKAIDNIDRCVAEGDTSASLAVLRGLGLLGGRPVQIGSELAAEMRGDQKLKSMRVRLSCPGGSGSDLVEE